jgi:small nuclear ribonucleoprotein D3
VDFGLSPKFERNSLILSDLCHEIRIPRFRFRPRIVGNRQFKYGYHRHSYQLLHDAQGHVAMVELTNGSTYRGNLIRSEDTCDFQLEDVLAADRTGRENYWNSIYIRGSHVRFFVIPVMLRHALVFQIRDMRKKGEMRGAK